MSGPLAAPHEALRARPARGGKAVVLCALLALYEGPARAEPPAQPAAPAGAPDAGAPASSVKVSGVVSAPAQGSPARSGAKTSERSGNTAAARELFRDGVAHADAGRWGKAAERFRRSLSLRASDVVTYNLSAALVELGSLTEASELLRTIHTAAEDPGVRRAADDLLQRVLPGLASLTFAPGEAVNGLAVLLDGRRLSGAQLDAAVAVDPGSHRFLIERHGHLLAAGEVRLAEGEAREILLPAHTHIPSPLEVARAACRAQDDAHWNGQGASLVESGWFWLGAGTVVATLAVVVMFASRRADSGPASMPAAPAAELPVVAAP
ncbi:MAG: hypothetical protein MJD61_21205 [Proteobacteria bacterium]|nr:hypothetical protein [Pseudomonadota bacterium]